MVGLWQKMAADIWLAHWSHVGALGDVGFAQGEVDCQNRMYLKGSQGVIVISYGFSRRRKA
jgi:hypothetical protein